MIFLLNKLTLAVTVLLALGCSQSAKKTDSPAESAKVKPTYSEKIGIYALAQVKTICPANVVEQEDWKKSVPMANACVKAARWDQVEKWGEYLAVKAHLTPWGPYFLSLAAASKNDFPRAFWMLELALKKAPSEGLFHYQMGRLHWEMGDETAALKALSKSQELNAELKEAHHLLGHLALLKQDYGQAQRSFSEALRLDENFAPSAMGLASVAIGKKDWREAEQRLSLAIRLNPRSIKPRFALAFVQEKHLQKVTEALESYREIKQMVSDKKFEDSVPDNLEEKIRNLEKSLTATQSQASVRTPTSQSNDQKQVKP